MDRRDFDNVQINRSQLEGLSLVSADDLDAWDKEHPLAYEKSIVWLEEIEALRFVRVRFLRNARARRGPRSAGRTGTRTGP